jgi:hypothetical protein
MKRRTVAVILLADAGLVPGQSEVARGWVFARP